MHCKNLLFLFLLILSVQAVKLQSTTVKACRAVIRNSGVPTNHFELLLLKQDQTYFVWEFRRKYVCGSEI